MVPILLTSLIIPTFLVYLNLTFRPHQLGLLLLESSLISIQLLIMLVYYFIQQ